MRDSLEAPSIPASVRSFSRDSLGQSYDFAHGRADSLGSAGYSGPPVAIAQPQPRARIPRYGSPDSSVLSPPGTPPVPYSGSGLWPMARSRSPLACPPTYSPSETVVGSPNPEKSKQSYFKDKMTKGRFKSTALLDIDTVALDKPWRDKKDALTYVSYWLTWSMVLLMAGASALLTLIDLNKIHTVGNLCLVLDDNFDNGIDRSIWFHEVDMGGFGYVFNHPGMRLVKYLPSNQMQKPRVRNDNCL